MTLDQLARDRRDFVRSSVRVDRHIKRSIGGDFDHVDSDPITTKERAEAEAEIIEEERVAREFDNFPKGR